LLLEATRDFASEPAAVVRLDKSGGGTLSMKLLVFGFLLAASSTFAHPHGSVVQISLHSAAIAENAINEPANQTFAVYLPPSYQTGSERYPVVVLLHGLGATNEVWTRDFNVAELLDDLSERGKIQNLIVVMPNAKSRFMGSFYANSPITGRWEDFIVNEIIPRVDHEFRTIPARESRAVVGWSMGGFGAIRLGMHRPDIFSVVYAISPCCLDAVEEIGNANVAAWSGILKFTKYEDVDAALKAGNWWPVAVFGLLSAIDPNPSMSLGVRIPVTSKSDFVVPLEPNFQEFRSKFPLHQIAEYRDNLCKLKAFGLDYGLDDEFAQVPAATEAFSKALNDAHVPHILETYFGDHSARVRERLATRVFPYLSVNLERASK
jgi:S-formylglutathione hydrolase